MKNLKLNNGYQPDLQGKMVTGMLKEILETILKIEELTRVQAGHVGIKKR